MLSTQNFNIVLKKYIKKYYFYKIIRGSLIALTFIGLAFLIIAITHYFFFFNIIVKKIIFISFILSSAILLLDLIVLNILKLYKFLPTISNFDAAKNIAHYFPEIKDKLINILELQALTETDNQLIQASIDHKIEQIKFFNFTEAINFAELKSYLKYLLVPILIFSLILMFNKKVLTNGTEKFINYSVYYQPEKLFDYKILNKNLSVEAGQDIEIILEVSGKILPDIVNISFGNNIIPMSKETSKNIFKYQFQSVNKTFNFYFTSQGIKSPPYSVKVLPSPTIANFLLNVIPPTYTNQKPFTIENSGDLLVPYGSIIKFNFKSLNSDSLFLEIDSNTYTAKKTQNSFNINYVAKKSAHYTIKVKNKYFTKEILKYNISVIPDMFPTINIQQAIDSNIFSKYYFKGFIEDDYGFSKLYFNYAVTKDLSNINSVIFKKIPLNFIPSQLSQNFYYLYDFKDVKVSDNQQVVFFFSVSDNDHLAGYKTVETQKFTYKPHSLEQIDSTINSLNSSVQEKFNASKNLLKNIQDDIENFNKKMFEENMSDWEKKDFLNQLVKKQATLQAMIDSLAKQNKDKINNLNQLEKQNKELLEKQKLIQDLLDNLLTDEMKKLLDSLNNFNQKLDEKKISDLLKNSEKDFLNLSKNLDQSLELLKRMQIEQQLNNLTQKIDKKAQDINKLNEKLKSKKDISSEFEDELLTKEFEQKQLRNEYDSILSKNSELEKPFSLDSLNEKFDKIAKDFEESKKSMFDKNKKKTKQNMQKISEDMQQLKNSLSQMMQKQMMQQNSEDIQTLKFLLSNILTFSFEQEKLYNNVNSKITFFSPKYKKYQKEQMSLNDDFSVVRDSLNNLAKRNPMVGTVIKKELFSIEKNLSEVTNLFLNNNIQGILLSQRKIILSANVLALMLEESLKNMQKNKKQGGASTKPNNTPQQPGFSGMQKMQKAMQKQLEQMLSDMKKGKKPGSKSLGEQLAQREALQKLLKDFINNMGEGKSEMMRKILDEISKMNEEVKNDIINRNITPQTLMRDKQITTRLLEAQNADEKRKFSEKRQSKTAQNINRTTPKELKKYFDTNLSNPEILNKYNIKLNNFYKTYFNGYIYRLSY